MTSNKEIIKGLKQAYRSLGVDSASIERNRAKLLAYFKENFPYQKESFIFYLKPVLVSLVILFVIITGLVGLINEAKGSLPGSQLYVLKRTYEELTLKFLPKEERSLARTEIAQKRLAEMKTLVQNVEFKNSEVPLSVKKATQELKKEIVSLKKEIALGKGENISDFSDLPIRDDKKIIQAIAQKDLDKLLAETKEAIKEKNLVMALEKIGEAEKIFIEPQNESQVEKNNSSQESKENESEVKSSEEKTVPQTYQPDFKTNLELEKKESDFKTDLIKE